MFVIKLKVILYCIRSFDTIASTHAQKRTFIKCFFNFVALETDSIDGTVADIVKCTVYINTQIHVNNHFKHNIYCNR